MGQRKLELKEIAGYLPHRLYCEFTNYRANEVKIADAWNLRLKKDCIEKASWLIDAK